MVRAVERTAREAELQILLADTSEHPDEEVRAARTFAPEVDGFVVLSPRRLHRELDALGGKPAVFVNRPVTGYGSVLLRVRHRRRKTRCSTWPASVIDRSPSWAVLRDRGRLPSAAALSERPAARPTSTSCMMDASAPTFEAAADAVPRLIRSTVSGVIAFNDQMALGVIAGLARRGIAVPRGMSVVGFDDVPMAAMVAPPLTTIRLPTEEAGVVAVDGTPGEESTSDEELVGQLVVRSPTGPVTKRRANAGADGARRPSAAGPG